MANVKIFIFHDDFLNLHSPGPAAGPSKDSVEIKKLNDQAIREKRVIYTN